jgi:uncharacterized protein (DUF362 family)
MDFKTDRREFLGKGLAAAGAVLTGAHSGLLGAPSAWAATYPDIAIARGSEINAMTRAAVDTIGGMKRFVKPGAKVVIKPNMSFARDVGSGSNTNPEVVASVAQMCSEAGASQILVLDNVLHSPEDCLSMSKIPETCGPVPKTSVSNVRSKRMFREVKVPKGVEFKSMEVISQVLDSDVLIAVPVGKSHGSAGVSLSMKGMMGLIYDRGSFHRRYNLHEAIVDMVTILKPDLVVTDGTRILSEGGPGGPGKVIPLNLVIASDDMVAADAQMVELGTWYGKKFKADQVRHIRIAAERGLGRADISALSVKDFSI